MMRATLLSLLSVPLAALSLAADTAPSEIRPPDGAVLVAESTVEESESAPEQQGNTIAEHIVAVGGIDRVYRVPKSYRDAVSFFEGQLGGNGLQILEHKAGPRETSWQVKRSDGTIARVVVRKHRVTEVEIAQAAGAHQEQPIRTVEPPLGDTL